MKALIVAIFIVIEVFAAFNYLCLADKSSFRVNTVPNEFIVQFHRKYVSKVRQLYIQARFQRFNISNWTIIHRENIANNYPSDFDILQIASDSDAEYVLSKIRSHPAIKAIVPQRSVRRIFSYKDNNTCTYNSRSTRGIPRSYISKTHSKHVTELLHAEVFWNLGITGQGIKVAIFDTGLTKGHPHFRNVKERTNWTNEKSLDDGVSHGTFVAGVIASSKECLGLAPDAELHIFKVFTNSQVSYTSWFLDAFNYAIYKKVNILNLSIGGPDFMDSPFVEKVLELSANKIIMVSAIGNDGPFYGTLNNPGDQSDVVGVGGINFDDKLAKFSSRGMTTWELPLGYGRLKPDIVTYGSQVEGSDIRSGCRRLSGTSVSSPVVAGVAALLASGALKYHKMDLMNPASLKQVLIEGAIQLPDYNMFEQGHGKLSLLKSMQLLLSYKPKISLIPSYIDFTSNYMWPYSSQPLFYGGMAAIINVTILNGISVTGRIVGSPQWIPDADNGYYINISTSHSTVLWPWSGWMAVFIVVNEIGQFYEGLSKGKIILYVENDKFAGNGIQKCEIQFPITVKITPKPPRLKRLLWDQYHSLRYPPGYIPRDDLKKSSDPLDWTADHIHTNFRDMYIHLRNAGYYIDVLRQPYICFNASEYGALLIVDPEEEFLKEEIIMLESYVYDEGLSVIVFADWYNTTVMRKIKFFDENTRQWWIPDTGGSNIPALNDLLHPFGIAFGDFVGEGHFKLGDHSMYYASGSSITKFPTTPGDIVIGTHLNDQGFSIINNSKIAEKMTKSFVAILGLFQTRLSTRLKKIRFFNQSQVIEKSNIELKDQLFLEEKSILNNRIYFQDTQSPANRKMKTNFNTKNSNSNGRIVVYGDSNCLESTNIGKACFWLLSTILDFTMNSHKSRILQNLNKINEFSMLKANSSPLRLSSSKLGSFSKAIDGDRRKVIQCEQRQWINSKTVNSSHNYNLRNQSTTTMGMPDFQDTILINIVNTDIAIMETMQDKIRNDRVDFNITYITLMVALSLAVVIFFILFLRGRLVYKF